MANLGHELHRFVEIIKQCEKMEGASPHCWKMKTQNISHGESKPYRNMTVGQRDQIKPHKTILMVGETGLGKTTLINVMVNYMLGVERKDKVWFEITDDQSYRSSVHSQTSIITVYGVYLQKSPMDLTIIDTPGYGDTHAENNKIAGSLLSLIKSEKINKLDAVCLVIKATQNRLSDQQIYIFDAVQSLFGRDIADNIVLLLTFSRGEIPKKVLMTVKEAKVKCAVNKQNQPVYFLFDNCQSESADEENEIMAQSWNLSSRGMRGFFSCIDLLTSKHLLKTQDVLTKRNELEEIIPKIQSHIKSIELKQNELEKSKGSLKQNQENSKEKKVETNKDTDPLVASEIKCPCDYGCLRCCLYTRCSRFFLWCRSWFFLYCCSCCCSSCCSCCCVKKDNQRQTEYEIIYPDESLVKKLTEERQELEKTKKKLVTEAFDIVETLKSNALDPYSPSTLLHIDFLIEKLKEINEPEKAKTLEDMKSQAGEVKHRGPSFLEGTRLNTPDQTN